MVRRFVGLGLYVLLGLSYLLVLPVLVFVGVVMISAGTGCFMGGWLRDYQNEMILFASLMCLLTIAVEIIMERKVKLLQKLKQYFVPSDVK